ncbi:MAG: hypothetical protein QME41_00520 [Actinomycetota bacterium]|nr:hypothetical protein [Actinomycetota bacterium]
MDSTRLNARNIVIAAVALLFATSGYYVYQAFAVALRSEALYVEAQKAFESGDDDAAESVLVEVVRINPAHEDAKDLLLQIKQGIDVAAEPRTSDAKSLGGGMRDANPGEGLDAASRKIVTENRFDDRNGLTDDMKASGAQGQLPGYKLVSQESGLDQSKSIFEALDQDAPVEFIELRIEKHTDASGAAEALHQRRFAYPKVQQKIMFNNRMAYHGTDGKKTAILAWARAEELVELKAISSGDTTAGSLNSLLEAAKELF